MEITNFGKKGILNLILFFLIYFSGCNWKQQLKQFDNIEKNLKQKEKEDWEKVAEFRMKEDAKFTEFENEYEPIQHSMVALAPRRVQDMHYQEIRKKYKSHVVNADELLQSALRYIPAKNKSLKF